ncbi:MAG: hypothetical protein AAF628_16420 [Planctomycetota bacterium]
MVAQESSDPAMAGAAAPPARRPRPFLLERAIAHRHEYGRALFLLLLLHAALYLLDPAVQYYFGDSGGYLHAAQGYVPADRSFLYGKIIRAVALRVGDLAALVAFQIAVFIATTLLLQFVLREYLRVGPRLALGGAVIASGLPVHMIWTRYVMTETCALAGVTMLLVLALEYVRSGRWAWLLPLHVVGIASIAIRSAALPSVLAVAVVLPVLVGGTAPSGRFAPRARWRSVLLHLAISLAVMVPLHEAYKSDYAGRRERAAEQGWYELEEPAVRAYNQESGRFVISFVAPLVRPEDFPVELDGAAVLAATPGVDDRRNRIAQQWRPEGLYRQVLAAVKAAELEERGDRVASAVARRTVLRDPLGVLQLGWNTLLDFWSPRFGKMIYSELGFDGEEPRNVATLLRRDYARTLAGYTRRDSPLKQAFRFMEPYVAAVAFLFLGVPLLVLIQRRETRRSLLVLGGLLFCYGAGAVWLTSHNSARFLHPVLWLAWAFLLAWRPGAFWRRSAPATAVTR